MPQSRWSTPGALSSNIASTVLDSLANAATSAFMNYDNSIARDLYASVRIELGSIDPTDGGSITLRAFIAQGAEEPDATGSVGGGESYTQMLDVTSSAKTVIIPMIRLYPFPMRFQITNASGVTLAASGNECYIQPYNEQVV
jgi:hypothetical protein